MPLTLLDIILLVVMLISAILAMVRGFMREVLSIASWAAAAILTVYAYPKLLPVAKQYVNHDLIAAGIVIAGVFLGTLLIVSIITIKISDMILDSRIGALDRTLGFLFGLARGLLIVVVAFLFFAWLVPEKSQPEWVRNAKSRVVLQSTGEALMSMLPEDPEGYLRRLKRSREGQEPETNPPEPGTRSETAPPARGADQPGYARSDRLGMQQLLNTSATPKAR
ncbi:MAG TPA: CvpA family protein [Xanthobacteraceae bacterium]|nr:CvpA family protein [Xanthobacteraceae bacterium]